MPFNQIIELRKREALGKFENVNYDSILNNLKSDANNFMVGEAGTAVDSPIFACKFCPQSNYNNIVSIANEDGILCFDNTEKKSSKTFYAQPHHNAIFDIEWMPQESKLVTASGDHSAKLLDIGNGKVDVVAKFTGHVRSVKSISFKPENNAVFATGSRDGTLNIWDIRSSTKCTAINDVYLPDQVLLAYVYPETNSQKKSSYPKHFSVTGVLFQDDNTLISCGSSDSCVQLWDMRRTYTRNKKRPTPKAELFTHNNGISNLCLNQERSKLYVNCIDSCIYCYNVNSCQIEPIASYFGHSNCSYYVKSCISHDNKYLISGSSDEYIYIWKTKEAEYIDKPTKPLMRLRGHVAEVTGVDTSYSQELQIVSGSDDGTYRIWSLNMGNQTEEDEKGVVCSVEKEIQGLVTPQKSKIKLKAKSSSVPKKLKVPTGNIIKFFSESKKNKITYDGGNSSKKLKLQSIKENPNTPRSKRKLMDILEEGSSSEVGAEAKRQALSPIKNQNSLVDGLSGFSPIRINPPMQQLTSPTVNLPNFVIDGTSPYSHKCPGLKRHSQDLDWLSKIRKEKERKIDEQNDLITPEKKISRSTSTDKQPNRTLLTYFKVSTKARSNKVDN